MKYISYILFLSYINLNAQTIKYTKIPMSKWTNKGGLHDKNVNNRYLIFEKYFDDSIKVIVEKKIIANKLIKTNKRIEASNEFITFETKGSQKIYIYINKKCYFFNLKKRYKYYYFNHFEDKIGIQYSNYQREYY